MQHTLIGRHPRRLTRYLYTTLVVLTCAAFAACDSFTGDSSGTETLGLGHASASAVVASGDGCVTGRQPGGAIFEICRPDAAERNGTLAIYSHGFVFPQQPLGIPTIEAGINVREFLLSQGYDYAATSFHANGLLRPELAVRDLHNLVVQYTKQHGRPERVILFGISNGALIGTHAIEKHKNLFDGALTACAPNGSFQRQVNYFGDLLVLFQHFFPGVVAGTPEGIPSAYLTSLATAAAGFGVTPDLYLAGAIQSVLLSDFPRTGELLSVIRQTPSIGASFTSSDQGIETLIRGLVYNVFATNNAVDVLRGAYFDNGDRTYIGSTDDAALNASIARYTAANNVKAQMKAHYETQGRLSIPVVSLHTLHDPTVPFWQTSLYRAKLGLDEPQYALVEIDAFGHCAFEEAEIAAGLEALVADIRG